MYKCRSQQCQSALFSKSDGLDWNFYLCGWHRYVYHHLLDLLHCLYYVIPLHCNAHKPSRKKNNMQGLPTLLLTLSDGRWCWIVITWQKIKVGCVKRGVMGERDITYTIYCSSSSTATSQSFSGVERLARDRLKSTPVHIYASIHHSVMEKRSIISLLVFHFQQRGSKRENSHPNYTISCVWWAKVTCSITNMMKTNIFMLDSFLTTHASAISSRHFDQSTAFHIHLAAFGISHGWWAALFCQMLHRSLTSNSIQSQKVYICNAG